MAEETKKTKKYYRDEINASYSRACRVFEEAIVKYCPKKTYTNWQGKKVIDQRCGASISNHWNGCIEGFYVTNTRPKKVYVSLYVQGDDTDSSDSVLLSEFIRKGYAEASFVEGYHNTSYKQNIVARFDQEHLYEAMKQFADKFLSPAKKKTA